MKKNLVLLSAMIVASLSFTGCVVKQKVAMGYDAPTAASATYPSVDVTVTDKRPYIVDGEKPASYIGTYRGGFGNPFNVNTADNVPFADLLKDDIAKELAALGFGKPNGTKKLLVDIRQWKFDAYQNAKFNYILDVKVIDATDANLAESSVEGKDIYIQGTVWGGGKAGVERDMPKLYNEAIQKIVRKNADILNALKK
jgi:hypothetical protein